MSSLDHAARLLAARDGDDGLRRALTRREAVVAAAAGLGAATVLGPLTRNAAAASTDDYCYAPCIKAARETLSAQADRLKAVLIRSLLQDDRFRSLVDCAYIRAGNYAEYYDARAACKGQNCGDPGKYPPPQPTCTAPCPAGASCQPCPTADGGGICCLDIFPLVNGKSQCCPG